MTTEKQKAAEKYVDRIAVHRERSQRKPLWDVVAMRAFLAGVAWRDKHPQKRKGGRQA